MIVRIICDHTRRVHGVAYLIYSIWIAVDHHLLHAPIVVAVLHRTSLRLLVHILRQLGALENLLEIIGGVE